MRFRIPVSAVAAAALLAFTPVKAHAQAAAPCSSGAYTLGMGGYLSGCWGSVTARTFFENAGDVSQMYWFSSFVKGVGNAPDGSSVSTSMFNDDAGSIGCGPGCGMYFGGTFFGVTKTNTLHPTTSVVIPWLTYSPELIFGLNDPTSGWVYSGPDASRNDIPDPAGLQNFLIEITGVGDNVSHFLLAWEDLNSGCLSSSTGASQTKATVLSATELDDLFATCASGNPGGIADRDYNDFYVLLDAETLGRDQSVVPEPATMTLLATGLAGIAGASFRKRNKKS